MLIIFAVGFGLGGLLYCLWQRRVRALPVALPPEQDLLNPPPESDAALAPLLARC